MRTLCAVVLLVFIISHAAHATSVIEVSMEEMLQNSALVFEGEVTDVKVREDGNRVIHTQVTFEIIDVIKGNMNGRKNITLDFLGGEMGGRRLSVSEMHMPELHERGIYFVESPGRRQVHPLYGWSQGHFKVTTDAGGTPRVFTRAGMAVKGVEHTNGRRTGRISQGVARGLMVGVPGEAAAALDVGEFKRQLRAMQ